MLGMPDGGHGGRAACQCHGVAAISESLIMMAAAMRHRLPADCHRTLNQTVRRVSSESASAVMINTWRGAQARAPAHPGPGPASEQVAALLSVVTE